MRFYSHNPSRASYHRHWSDLEIELTLDGVRRYKRIRQAIQGRATFRVIVVLPVHPDGTFEDSAAVRYIMKWCAP